MAVYDNLPVYKAAYDLLRSVYEKTGKIPRDVKYTLVEVLKKGSDRDYGNDIQG